MAYDLETEEDKNTSASVGPKNVEDLRQSSVYSNVDIFKYEEMKSATKGFQPDLILEDGGFGVVYRGVIDSNVRPGYNTLQVAIKELNRDGFQGDREWLAILYEYMASGSLVKESLSKSGMYSEMVEENEDCC